MCFKTNIDSTSNSLRFFSGLYRIKNFKASRRIRTGRLETDGFERRGLFQDIRVLAILNNCKSEELEQNLFNKEFFFSLQ